MKAQIFEQAQSQLGYLGRNNNIFTDNETSLKREAGELPPTDFCQKLFTISLLKWYYDQKIISLFSSDSESVFA